MAQHLATITLIGHDKAGVIARITQLLFQLGANIEAMEEQVTRGQFSMTLQASWTPARFDRAKIQASVTATGRDLDMEAKIHFAPTGPQRLALLVTKEPHVLEGLLAKSEKALGAKPVVVIGNRPALAPLAKKQSFRSTTSPSRTAPAPNAKSSISSKNTKSISSCSRAL